MSDKRWSHVKALAMSCIHHQAILTMAILTMARKAMVRMAISNSTVLPKGMLLMGFFSTSVSLLRYGRRCRMCRCVCVEAHMPVTFTHLPSTRTHTRHAHAPAIHTNTHPTRMHTPARRKLKWSWTMCTWLMTMSTS